MHPLEEYLGSLIFVILLPSMHIKLAQVKLQSPTSFPLIERLTVHLSVLTVSARATHFCCMPVHSGYMFVTSQHENKTVASLCTTRILYLCQLFLLFCFFKEAFWLVFQLYVGRGFLLVHKALYLQDTFRYFLRHIKILANPNPTEIGRSCRFTQKYPRSSFRRVVKIVTSQSMTLNDLALPFEPFL